MLEKTLRKVEATRWTFGALLSRLDVITRIHGFKLVFFVAYLVADSCLSRPTFEGDRYGLEAVGLLIFLKSRQAQQPEICRNKRGIWSLTCWFIATTYSAISLLSGVLLN